MKLTITVALFVIFCTSGHSLKCHECIGYFKNCAGTTNEKTCPAGTTHCISATTKNQITGSVYAKQCAPLSGCAYGFWNNGKLSKASFSCCNTDNCNSKDDPDFSTRPNGYKCYTCEGADCWKILSCNSGEDRCITTSKTNAGVTFKIKGCASKSLCDASAIFEELADVTCCEGNLCNSAEGITEGFLVFFSSLLFYFIFH